ncbi:MAG TPA: ribbon-helix-helix domain-containing protein [Anaeromyxobacteraceae bacterium]|nr:ribbon-helix-helix domain-containing protein [Anaeromyxobacteraceae bacterium]
MNLQAPVVQASISPISTSRLEPMLIRLPPALASQLRELARATRVRQSDYLREAVADLLAKYSHVHGVPLSEPEHS